jgi:hypothetical protein
MKNDEYSLLFVFKKTGGEAERAELPEPEARRRPHVWFAMEPTAI